jgi:hypothetical protein
MENYMGLDLHRANTLGGIVSLFAMGLCILIFLFRLGGLLKIERWLGILFLATAIPFTYLLITAGKFQRPVIYYIQLLVILLFMLIELSLDYIFIIDFRKVRWMTITYVIFFFAGTGGLIGIATQAGKTWTMIAVVLFLIMTFLAFFQRAKTGM